MNESSKAGEELSAMVREAMFQGACMMLGWDGEGLPARKIRRAAADRLTKVQQRLARKAHP